MAWEEYDGHKRDMGGTPKISLYFYTFALNASFVKWAKLELPCYVVIYIDEQKKQIGFKFYKEQKKNSFKVSPYKNRMGAQFTNTQIKKCYPWVNDLLDQSANLRSFPIEKDQDMYFIEIKGGEK